MRIYPTSQCVDTIPEHYYEDTTNGVYRQCNEACKTCQGELNEITGSTNCIECNVDYFPYSNDPTNCTDSQPEGYYLFISDTGEKSYDKCYKSCKTCSIGGDDDYNNCNTCLKGYYPIEGKETTCVKNPPYYYLDSDNYYKQCYPSCEECSKGEEGQQHNCDICKVDTLAELQSDGTYNCYFSCTDNKKYYEKNCIYCPIEMAVVGQNCINCKEKGQYKLDNGIGCDAISYPEHQCSEDLPDNYYLIDSDYNYYKECDSNCKTCEISSNNCLSCYDTYPILYNHECLSQCPIVNGSQLYRLPDNRCIEECPDYLIKDDTNFKCSSCNPDYKYAKENKCYRYDELPLGYHIFDNEYNSFNICHSNCEECFEISTDDTNQKCTKM